MTEIRPSNGEALPVDMARREDSAERVRTIELAGRQNLVDLVHRGRVRLHGEDGATVELWGPEQVPDFDYKYRVHLNVHFSEGMRARYSIDEKPLPENPTCILNDTWEVEVGSRICGNQSFAVDGWDLYNDQGKRIRHHDRTFVLRDLSRVELLVPDDVRATDTPSASETLRNLGTQAILGNATQAAME